MMHHPANPNSHGSLWSRARFEPMTIAATLTAAAATASAAGSIMSGKAAESAGRFEAAQMNQQAGQERAASQRVAIEQRRRANLAISKSRAISAGSGAGASDPSVLNIEGNLAGEGEYNALSAIYQGEEAGRGYETGATAKRFEGQQKRQASMIGAGSTIMGAGVSLLDKYGQGGYKATPADYTRTGAVPGSMVYDSNAKLPWLLN
jgi:hypothetical protein